MNFKEMEILLNKLKDVYSENLEIINISVVETVQNKQVRVIFRRDGEGIDDYITMFRK